MPSTFTITAEMPANCETIYNAWLDPEMHSAMTGSAATAGPGVGDPFTAFDDYASGKNLELLPFSRIVQSWRTTEFTDDEEDSVVEIRLEDKGDRTLLTLTHSNLPAHGSTYKQGWKDFYFAPMLEYFRNDQ